MSLIPLMLVVNDDCLPDSSLLSNSVVVEAYKEMSAPVVLAS